MHVMWWMPSSFIVRSTSCRRRRFARRATAARFPGRNAGARWTGTRLRPAPRARPAPSSWEGQLDLASRTVDVGDLDFDWIAEPVRAPAAAGGEGSAERVE